ncbi:MAG: hypothetical protein PHH44_05380, partial [bacterium]|nr:hypothetical protein [bacterium]
INSPLYSFCVDNEGNIYIVHGTSCDELTKFNNNGSVLWTKKPSEFNAPVKYSFIEHIRINNGYLYLVTSLNNAVKFIKINKDGIFLEEVLSDDISNDGNFYTGSKIYSSGNLFWRDQKDTGKYTSGLNIDIVNTSGSIIKILDIIFPDTYQQSNQSRGLREFDSDSKGNIYSTVYIYRILDQYDKFSNGLLIDTDNFVFKFDKEGRYISTITFPASPFLEQGNVIFLDNNDDLYYLQFHEDKMDVVKVTSDNIPPETAISISPFPNALGWNNTDTAISLNATDNEGGSGVKEIHYTLTGAINEDKSVPGQSAQILLQKEGSSSLSYYALDKAGNKDDTKSFSLKLDKTIPVVSLFLEPYKIKLPFWHEKQYFYTPFFFKLVYSAQDTISGIKEVKTGMLMPDIAGFKTQMKKDRHINIIMNTKNKQLMINAPDPNAILEQLKSGLLLINKGQLLHLNQRPRAQTYIINKNDKFLTISAPEIIFKAKAADEADNSTMKELKYEKKKIPLPDHCKLMIKKKQFSKEEIEDLKEDMDFDQDSLKFIKENYK